tara:strand:- start:10475 stop:11281 length:807 start_codon:yes stop_codon:yes gene_type:complete
MKSVVILTAGELRHDYFKIKFSSQKDIAVLKTYCDLPPRHRDPERGHAKNIESLHFASRHQVEKDFFEEYVGFSQDRSNSRYLARGAINEDEYIEEILSLNPDFIVAYGCCIIKSRLLKFFKNKIINVHLGLSPYYFGSGTNFHPFVTKELGAIGCTFMYMDEGIDTGDIIHQVRAHIDPCDSIHQVGTRLIKKMTQEFIELIRNMERLEAHRTKTDKVGKTYKRRDCTAATIEEAYNNIREGVCLEYLKNKSDVDANFPLIRQSFLC